MRLAIVKLSALGDIVHASFLPQIIKKELKNIQIDWFCEERFADILDHNPYIDNVKRVALKQKPFSEIVRVFKFSKYDKVIDLQGLIKSAVVSKILGKSYGFDSKSTRESFASFFYSKSFRIPYEKNVILRNYQLVSNSLGIEYNEEKVYQKEPSLFFKNEDHLDSFFDKKRKNIVIVMGSSWESKIYPKEKYAHVIKKIDANFLLSWGNDKEKKDAMSILKECDNVSILPKTSLNGLKYVISKSDFTIGGDSGPTHIAWALNKPSITIFGPTPSNRNSLQTDINYMVDCKKKIDANKLDRNDMCIKSIDENEIVALTKRILNG